MQQQVQQPERPLPAARNHYGPHQQLKRPSATMLPLGPDQMVTRRPAHGVPVPCQKQPTMKDNHETQEASARPLSWQSAVPEHGGDNLIRKSEWAAPRFPDS
jgi:hypothetical protein